MLTTDDDDAARSSSRTCPKSITPFTVRQLHGVTGYANVGGGEGPLCYKNKQVSIVQLCVKLVARETELPLSDLVHVEDGTGTVACFFYRNHEAAPPRPDYSAMAYNRYYMVFGTLRALTALRGFPGTHIHVDVVGYREMTDANELTNHFLRCIYEDARAGAK